MMLQTRKKWPLQAAAPPKFPNTLLAEGGGAEDGVMLPQTSWLREEVELRMVLQLQTSWLQKEVEWQRQWQPPRHHYAVRIDSPIEGAVPS